MCPEVRQHLLGTQMPPGLVATVQRVTHLKTKALEGMTTRTPLTHCQPQLSSAPQELRGGLDGRGNVWPPFHTLRPLPHPTQGPWPERSASVNIWFTSCAESILPARSPKASSHLLTDISK